MAKDAFARFADEYDRSFKREFNVAQAYINANQIGREENRAADKYWNVARPQSMLELEQLQTRQPGELAAIGLRNRVAMDPDVQSNMFSTALANSGANAFQSNALVDYLRQNPDDLSAYVGTPFYNAAMQRKLLEDQMWNRGANMDGLPQVSQQAAQPTFQQQRPATVPWAQDTSRADVIRQRQGSVPADMFQSPQSIPAQGMAPQQNQPQPTQDRILAAEQAYASVRGMLTPEQNAQAIKNLDEMRAADFRSRRSSILQEREIQRREQEAERQRQVFNSMRLLGLQ
jgi:hypothetical protein